MLFVFGWGRQTVKNHGPVEVYHCDHCNNDKSWTLYTRKTWFTLFFIPVIPYSIEHLALCPICNYGVKLDKQKFEEMKAVAECNLDLINEKISEDEHKNKLLSIRASGDHASLSEEAIPSGKTDTQLNYIKQMRELEAEQQRKINETSGV